MHLLSLSHHSGGIVVAVVASSVVVVMDVVVGVFVVIVEGVDDVVEVLVMSSVQLALPVLQPLQSWNGSISCDSRKHLWLSAM